MLRHLLIGLLIGLLGLAFIACDNPGKRTYKPLPDGQYKVDTSKAAQSKSRNKGQRDAQLVRQLMEKTIVKLPENRIVTSTSIDTELDEYLFTQLNQSEQAAFNIQKVFESNLRGERQLPTPEVFAMGKRKISDQTLVLFCAVHNTALHVYRLRAALYDADYELVDQVFLGKMDFINAGFRTRKYTLIFSPDKIEYTKGVVNQRRLTQPCNVLIITKARRLRTYENTCSRNR